MAYCEKFINGINAINFPDESAILLRNSLIAFAYQELKREHEAIQKGLSELPESFPENEFANTQLELYKNSQKENERYIATQLAALILQYGQKIEAEIVIDNPVHFIKTFAENFRDINHLAYTLSDAPPVIKELQTPLYIEVLFKLDPAEQEAQLHTLSLPNILDMVEQAIAMYDSNPKNVELRNQCQRLVHMGLYEIVRLDCNKIDKEAEAPQYIKYQEFIADLRSQLPKVGKSSVIDGLSNYKAVNGTSIGDLLAEVEDKFKITKAGDWRSDDKINALKARKTLFDTLRFGQEDRREYAKKTESNLTRDLFWARNIRDIELFTKSSTSDKVFAGITQRIALAQSVEFGPPLEDKKYAKFSTEEKRLATLILEVKALCRLHKPQPIPTGNTAILKKTPGAIPALKGEVRRAFEKNFSQPTIKIEGHSIKVQLYHKTKMADSFTDEILEAGGFGYEPDTLLNKLRGIEKNVPGIEGLSLSGSSLDDIERQINENGALSREAKAAYKSQLDKLKTEVGKKSEISSLKLDTSEEVLLRQLLELRYIKPLAGVTDNALIKLALDAIDTGNFVEALKVDGLQAAVKAAYVQLATMDRRTVEAHVIPIIDKSGIMASSARERLEKSSELQAAFESGVDVAKKVEDIFLDEYRAMKDTLKLTEEEVKRMEAEIKGMAEEMVRLIERTRAGQPAISETEQASYFSIVQQIANSIDQDISDVRFKVKHSTTGRQTVQVLNAEGKILKSVEVDVGKTRLPYSLVKPPGGDFIFSYGGTRGIIAPFEGLDTAYAGVGGKKGRLFTHSRLLGVGQYGSVKEVESLLSGLNQVIKKGYVPTAEGTPTFKDESRNELRSRPITARDDPLYRIESDVLKYLSQAESAQKGTISGGTQYWIEQDKPRESGLLFSKSDTPQQYQILTERAKGDTFADTANKKLNLFAKQDIAYHDPSKRDPSIEGHLIGSLKDTLDLSQAIVGEAQRFQGVHFSHNDIKPENFLYKKNSDGSYQVKFIDWATGGFEQTYNGTGVTAAAIFAELFEGAIPTTIGEKECTDANGRFVRIDGLKRTFGVDPTLQILHGARNGTLPYISPMVLGETRDYLPKDGSIPDPTMNTVLKTDDSYMDDWALTAMTFGVCNRQAYFTLVKGRAVTDYVIPGVLDLDGGKPPGLKISSTDNFNQFFACGSDRITEGDLQTGAAYNKKDAVMFIPSNQREGEPLHLYRRLQMVQEKLQASEASKIPDSPEQKIIQDINAILTEVHEVVAKGTGFTKAQLQEQLAAAQRCIKNYEKLNDLGYKEALLKGDTLQAVFNEHDKKNFTADSLLTFEGELRRIEILATYPSTEQQKEKAIDILNQAINETQLNDKFIGKGKPCRHLFRECIKEGQGEILSSLLAKITSPNKAFTDLVEEQGLLHYAAEQGMTDVFSQLVRALRAASTAETESSANNEIFQLMLKEYGPGDTRIHTAPQVKWATNCFHIAIRNNNKDQLAVILSLLPAGNETAPIINSALHLCAALGNQALFNQIISKYNVLNHDVADQINAGKVLKMTYPPDRTSPYHLFLKDKKNLDAIPWAELKGTAAVAKEFLLTPPAGTHAYPVLIAARNGNYGGVTALLELGRSAQLTKEEWSKLFTQSDEHGKNLFNYVLEQGQYTTLTGLLADIKQSCAEPQNVLVHLLSNPHPVNPIRNFLNFEKNEVEQFKILNQLFDEISPDFQSEETQKARIVALLVNEDWLLEKANNVSSQGSLEELLQNDKLSTPLKQGLFAKLAKDAKEPSPAKTFYTKLLAEVSPRQEAEMVNPVALEIPLQIMQEVARQNSDLGGLISALASGRDVLKEALDAQKKEYELKLQAQVDLAKSTMELTQKQLESEKQVLRDELAVVRESLLSETGNKERQETEIQRLTKALGDLTESGKEALDAQKKEYELKLQTTSLEKDEQITQLTETLKLVAQQKAVLALEKVIGESNEEQVRAIAEAKSIEDLKAIESLDLDENDLSFLKDPATFQKVVKAAAKRLSALEEEAFIPHRKEDAEDKPVEELGKGTHKTAKIPLLEPLNMEEQFREDELGKGFHRRPDSSLSDELFFEDEPLRDREDEELQRNKHRTSSGRSSLKPSSGAADEAQRDAFDALVAAIDQSKDYELLQLISGARTKEDLFKKTDFGRLNSKDVQALLDHPDEIGKIVERAHFRLARLDDFRDGQKQKILESPTQWQAFERLNREALKGPMEKMGALREVRKELRYLGETPMVWLNPAFQESAKPEAIKLESHFKELAEGADVIVPYLYRQRCVIKEFLAGLPDDREMIGAAYRDEVTDYRKLLTRYLRGIEDELRIHMPVQKLLKGNEDKKNLLEQQGMLQNIKQAKEDLKDLRQLSSIFKVSYTDYPIAEKNNHLDSSGKTGPGASLEVYEPDNTRPYQMVDRVKPDHFREHTVAVNNQVVGRFIEERVSGIDRIGVKPKVKLTVTSFPPATDPNGRVAYSVAMVTQLLAGLKEPPSAKNPIILRGENSEQLEYLWTALMIIGDKSPQMKFGPETIKISSSKHFNPDKEMGQGAEKFSPDSCYKKNFETCPQLNMLVADVAKLTSDKFGHKENQQKVHSHSGQAVTIFKGKMKEALEEMKQDNVIEERGPHSIK